MYVESPIDVWTQFNLVSHCTAVSSAYQLDIAAAWFELPAIKTITTIMRSTLSLLMLSLLMLMCCINTHISHINAQIVQSPDQDNIDAQQQHQQVQLQKEANDEQQQQQQQHAIETINPTDNFIQLSSSSAIPIYTTPTEMTHTTEKDELMPVSTPALSELESSTATESTPSDESMQQQQQQQNDSFSNVDNDSNATTTPTPTITKSIQQQDYKLPAFCRSTNQSVRELRLCQELKASDETPIDSKIQIDSLADNHVSDEDDNDSKFQAQDEYKASEKSVNEDEFENDMDEVENSNENEIFDDDDNGSQQSAHANGIYKFIKRDVQRSVASGIENMILPKRWNIAPSVGGKRDFSRAGREYVQPQMFQRWQPAQQAFTPMMPMYVQQQPPFRYGML
jgi:hypothetical protein